jgi:selenocysteine lyase/cysteine desulfurase
MIYFDNAATSRFKPKSALNILINELAKSSNSGRSAHRDAITTALKIEETRAIIQDKLAAQSANVVFTKNCTEALNLCLLKGGFKGHIISTVLEHNSTLRPLYRLNSTDKVAVTLIEPNDEGFVTASEIEPYIRRDTSLIAVNFVSNVTGAVADIEGIGKLAKSKNIAFLVDGAQGVPHIYFDFLKMGVDMLALPGHKGLHGFQGTGVLVFSDKVKIAPLILGGTGTYSSSVTQPEGYPESLESGTLFSAGIAALGEAVRWTYSHLREGNALIEKIGGELIYGLTSLGVKVYTKDARAGIVSFNLGDIPSSDVADLLNAADIAVRSGLHCAPLLHKYYGTEKQGMVRASVGLNNTDRDAAAFLNAIEKIVKHTSA